MQTYKITMEEKNSEKDEFLSFFKERDEFCKM